MSLMRLDEAVKNKELTLEQVAERKKVINTSADIIQNMPTKNVKGENLTDKEKLDYFYNLLIQDNAKKQKSVLSKAQQAKLEYNAMVADNLVDFIIDPKTPEELIARKKELENFLTPQKDKDGNEIVLNDKERLDAEAQLDAINTHLDKLAKEQEPVPTTEEILNDKATPGDLEKPTAEGKETIDEQDITGGDVIDGVGKYKGEKGSFS